MGFPEFNNLNRVYVVTSLTEVLSVIQIPKTEEKGLNFYEDEYIPVMVWEFFGPEAEVMKVGDKVKLEMSHYRLLKQIGPVPQTPRNFNLKELDKRVAIRKEMFRVFATNFNPSLIGTVKESVKELSNDDEVTYRCFYNSFKMYRCREYVIELAQYLISLAEQKEFVATTNEELISKFESLEFDLVLTKMLKEILGCPFSLSRNDPQGWYDDSKTLFSAYTLFKGAADYMVRFCERIKDGRAFFQESDRRSIDWDEAGSMEVWMGLSFLRSCSEEDRIKYSAMIKK